MTRDAEYPYSTADVAAKLGCSSLTVRNRAIPLGLGINIEGRTGYRFSDADVAALVESMRVVAQPIVKRRRRRGRSAVA